MRIHFYTKKPNLVLFGHKFAFTLNHSKGILCGISELKYIFSFDQITSNPKKTTCPECKERLKVQNEGMINE